MLDFDGHSGHLLMQRGNVVLTRQNVTLKLLNLIVEHEFELFKLLSFLLELNDPGIFVLNSGPSGVKLCLLSLNLVLGVIDGCVEGA